MLVVYFTQYNVNLHKTIFWELNFEFIGIIIKNMQAAYLKMIIILKQIKDFMLEFYFVQFIYCYTAK